nr:LFRYamide [Urechis unicinctus]
MASTYVSLLVVTTLGLMACSESNRRVTRSLSDLDKRLFRYGRNDNIFRYGKRADEDAEAGLLLDNDEDADDHQLAKRLFRWGKRASFFDVDPLESGPVWQGADSSLVDGVVTPLFRHARAGGKITTRTPKQPHVPFRFGDK